MLNKDIMDKLKVITEEERHYLEGQKEIDSYLYQSEVPSDLYTIDSKKLLESGKLVTIRPNTRFVHFPKHRHNYVEIMYMCQGKTTHFVDGNKIELNEGELLFLNQNAVQEILPAGIDDIGVNFIILPQFFQYSMVMMVNDENPLRNFILNCMTGENENVSYFHFKVANVIPIQNLVENMIWTIVNNQPNKRSTLEISMGLILLELINNMDTAETNNLDKGHQLTMEVLQYIDQNYRDGSLGELANGLHYEISFLSKEIKRCTGRTFTELLQEKRLSQAVYLLTHTALGIDDIAHDVGYENISYFHRIFNKTYGTTPNKYRKEYTK